MMLQIINIHLLFIITFDNSAYHYNMQMYRLISNQAQTSQWNVFYIIIYCVNKKLYQFQMLWEGFHTYLISDELYKSKYWI